MSVALEIEQLLRPIVRGPLPVHLTAWDGSVAGTPDGPRVSVNHPNALRRQVWAFGELGAAQAYATGELDVEGDLGSALEQLWAAARERRLTGVRVTPATILRTLRAARRLRVLGPPPPLPASQARLRGRLHGLRRDRAVISHHYDLSNEFYAMILDPHMAYSCAYFPLGAPANPVDIDRLERAQQHKLDLVCDKLGLQPGMRLLDVGCGWGSLSLRAAEEFGTHVVGITLSREQKAYIDRRIAERGLADRVDIRLQDYRRQPDDNFDAVASLEMGEHVGDRNYVRYARTLAHAVRPGGRVLIQQMSRHGKHPGGGPFIESFIAPDMSMRPVGNTIALIEQAGLEVCGVQGMREHYAWTIAAWIERLESQWDTVVSLVGEEVARVWRLYLTGARLSFEQGRMGVDQILAQRPATLTPDRTNIVHCDYRNVAALP